MAMFCSNCGTELPHVAKFCSNCGATINGGSFNSSQSGPGQPSGGPFNANPPNWRHAMPNKPLYRPHVGRAIAGVCIGLSQAYGWDVALVRIFTVVVFFFSGGIMGIAYLACWIGIPEEPFGAIQTPPSAYPPGI